MRVTDSLREQFNAQFELVERRPGIQQVCAPLYHEDGDMVDLYLDLPRDADLSPNRLVRISDHGMSLMRLSYTFDIDTENKQRIFERILAENGIREQDGELFLEVPAASLYPGILQFAQAIAKVCNMRYFKREVLADLFDEMLSAFIEKELREFNPEPNVNPLPKREDLEVDWRIQPNGVPVYVFGVKDGSQARLATIACLEFQRSDLKFKSLAVHRGFEDLTKKDRSRITNACDKQFTSLDEFKAHGKAYLQREKSHF